MDKLEETKKLQVCLAEKQLKSTERENEELLKILNESRQLIFNKSQPEVEGLKSQIDFLMLDQVCIIERVWPNLSVKKFIRFLCSSLTFQA